METTFSKTVCKPVSVHAETESERVTYNVSNTTVIKVHSTGLWIMFRFDNLKDIKIYLQILVLDKNYDLMCQRGNSLFYFGFSRQGFSV